MLKGLQVRNKLKSRENYQQTCSKRNTFVFNFFLLFFPVLIHSHALISHTRDESKRKRVQNIHFMVKATFSEPASIEHRHLLLSRYELENLTYLLRLFWFHCKLNHVLMVLSGSRPRQHQDRDKIKSIPTSQWPSQSAICRSKDRSHDDNY